jgi:hypothetical protein
MRSIRANNAQPAYSICNWNDEHLHNVMLRGDLVVHIHFQLQYLFWNHNNSQIDKILILYPMRIRFISFLQRDTESGIWKQNIRHCTSNSFKRQWDMTVKFH